MDTAVKIKDNLKRLEVIVVPLNELMENYSNFSSIFKGINCKFLGINIILLIDSFKPLGELFLFIGLVFGISGILSLFVIIFGITAINRYKTSKSINTSTANGYNKVFPTSPYIHSNNNDLFKGNNQVTNNFVKTNNYGVSERIQFKPGV